jgi:1,2-dihydroxy-3-keto-5-methylthiopentene dioxygenase
MRATWLPSNEPCRPEELRAEGIEHERFDAKAAGAVVEHVKKQRGLAHDERVVLSTENPKHEAAIAKEEDEHAHMADEVRLVLHGEVTYEVRAGDDRWIKLALEPGELVVIPAKRYHRFMLAAGTVEFQELFQDRGGLMPFYRVSNDDTRAV